MVEFVAEKISLEGRLCAIAQEQEARHEGEPQPRPPGPHRGKMKPVREAVAPIRPTAKPRLQGCAGRGPMTKAFAIGCVHRGVCSSSRRQACALISGGPGAAPASPRSVGRCYGAAKPALAADVRFPSSRSSWIPTVQQEKTNRLGNYTFGDNPTLGPGTGNELHHYQVAALPHKAVN